MKRLKDLCLVAEGDYSIDNGKFMTNYHTKPGHLYMIEVIEEMNDNIYVSTVFMRAEVSIFDGSRNQSGAYGNYDDASSYIYEDWDDTGWSTVNISATAGVKTSIKIYEVI